jgi:hypothetical protein
MDELKVGDRVRLTDHGRQARILQRRANELGTVVALDGPLGVTVLPDTYKNPRQFARSFWAKASSRRGE